MDELIALIDEKPIGRRKVNPEDDITIPDGDEQFDPDGEKTLTFEELQRRQQQQDNPSEDTIVTKKKGDTVQKNPLHPDSQKVEPQPSKPIVTPKPKQKSNTALIVVLCALIALVVAGGVTYFLLSDKPSSTEIAEGDETDATEEDEEDGEEKPIYSSDGRIIMRFTGKVENGQPVGRGLLTYLDDPDRVSYEGSFLNGLREDSAAVLTYRNGDVYRGQFIADHFGTGSYFIKETGEYFRGTFKDDQPNNGVWYDKDDNVLMTVSNGVSQ